MSIKSWLAALLLFMVIGLSVSPVGAFQDAKPTAKATAVVAPDKPKTVPITSREDGYHMQLLNRTFELNIERINALNRSQDELRKEADTLIKKMAADLKLSLDEYQLDSGGQLQFVLIEK